jgi:uncharacterized protein (DUF1499 family)
MTPARMTLWSMLSRHLSVLLVLVGAFSGCARTPAVSNGEDMAPTPVNFEILERRNLPNDYLVCPPGYCRRAIADRDSPSFPVSAQELRRRVTALLSRTPRTVILFADKWHILAEQRSRLLGFPDHIDIEVIPDGENSAALAIYSRSRYGYFDLGANRRRVEDWLRKIYPKKE